MSSIPDSHEEMLREFLWWAWSDDHDRQKDIEAIEIVLQEREELQSFLESVEDGYYRDAEKFGYEPSWQDYRGSRAYELRERFDLDEIEEHAERELEKVRSSEQLRDRRAR